MQLLFADQLGKHFELADELFLPVVKNQFKKRRYHRQKAHLTLYSLYARARDENVTLVHLNSYRDLEKFKEIKVAVKPSSRAMLSIASSLGIQLEDHRGFCSTRADFDRFVQGRKTLKLEDFYRQQRVQHEVLFDGREPTGGRWNFDSENRLPPPKHGLGLPEPWWPEEDQLDAQVRAELDELVANGTEFLGEDGPRRFAATHIEAESAAADFIQNRLDLFGPYEDAIDSSNWVMAHSMLSVPMNLGLIDPMQLVRRVEQTYLDGKARLESVEGFIRQVLGWRDYVWHLYWHFGDDYTNQNALGATRELPEFLALLDQAEVEARCLSETIREVRERSWAHHIPRLMILGNFMLQRGINPALANDWFIDAFADGTPWVMPANVIGMSLYADGGKMSTKPYAAGGSYINKMSNYCKDCPFDPKVRVGDRACPMTAGYWDFIGRNQSKFAGNHRMFQVLAGYRKLTDAAEIHEQEARRSSF